MNFLAQRSELRDLYEKVAVGERISEADALRLFATRDLNALGAIADLVRLRKVGHRASYIINRYINYSNYCILSCQFCSFSKKKRDADGFQYSAEEIVEKAREALALGSHGTAHCGRTASLAAVQLLHGHAAGLAAAGCATLQLNMLAHRHRDFAPCLACAEIRAGNA